MKMYSDKSERNNVFSSSIRKLSADEIEFVSGAGEYQTLESDTEAMDLKKHGGTDNHSKCHG